MLEFFAAYESIINIICAPIFFSGVLIPEMSEGTKKKVILKESLALICFIAFLVMAFNVFYNGLIKGF